MSDSRKDRWTDRPSLFLSDDVKKLYDAIRFSPELLVGHLVEATTLAGHEALVPRNRLFLKRPADRRDVQAFLERILPEADLWPYWSGLPSDKPPFHTSLRHQRRFQENDPDTPQSLPPPEWIETSASHPSSGPASILLAALQLRPHWVAP